MCRLVAVMSKPQPGVGTLQAAAPSCCNNLLLHSGNSHQSYAGEDGGTRSCWVEGEGVEGKGVGGFERGVHELLGREGGGGWWGG